MACIVWAMPNGEEFRVGEGVAHLPPPGAYNTGKIDWACDGQRATNQHEVDDMMERNGVQWGSAIKWVTNKIGIKQCSACKAREVILNSVAEKGWAATLKELKETF